MQYPVTVLSSLQNSCSKRFSVCTLPLFKKIHVRPQSLFLRTESKNPLFTRCFCQKPLFRNVTVSHIGNENWILCEVKSKNSFNGYRKGSIGWHEHYISLLRNSSCAACAKSANKNHLNSHNQKFSYSTQEKAKNTDSHRSPEADQDLKTKDESRIFEENVFEKENIFTIPNMLTMSRIVMTPFLGYLVLQKSFPLACGLFFIAGVSDLLDGWVARNVKNQHSAFGSFLDPLADKFLISVLFVTLSVSGVIPVPLTVIVILRDLLLISAAFYVRFISLPPPRTLTRYFNAARVTAKLEPLLISKINTALQIFLISVSLAAPVFGYMDHVALQALWVLTAGTTTASGIGYMFAKDTYKIIKTAQSKMKK